MGGDGKDKHMADAIYDTPVLLDVKIGIKIRGFSIDYREKIIRIDYVEVDSGEETVQRHLANIRFDGEAPDDTMRDFLAALTGDTGAPVAKTKRRIIRYMADKGIISAVTIGGELPPVEPPVVP